MRAQLIALLMLCGTAASAGDKIHLRDSCPPSFDQSADGTCMLVSLYALYQADPGQGGMRVPLPALRNRFTAAQADLGRYLFFDPLLSKDHTLSCAHCHHPAFGFSDGRSTSMGVGGVGIGPSRSGGKPLRRAAPTLWNVGFLSKLFWDGRATSLQTQAIGPLFSADEMGNNQANLERDLNANATYRELFSTAFPSTRAKRITLREIVDALAAFETTLISINSRYDHYAHGDFTALTAQEIQGLNVFRGFAARCAQCHIPPLFASSELAVVGAPEVVGSPYDLGAAETRSDSALRGAFKVPTLRNIACTPPYFQAGQFQSLEEVVDFYNAGRGHAVSEDLNLRIHWNLHMTRPELSRSDVSAVVAFLGALTDETLTPATPAMVPSGLPVVQPSPTSPNSCRG
jgi:cytochrome c peroxidase